MEALEGGDSSNKGEAVAATDTPASKPLGKRPVESVEGLDAITIEFGEGSCNAPDFDPRHYLKIKIKYSLL